MARVVHVTQVTRSPQPQGKAADENPQGVCLARVSTRSIFVRGKALSYMTRRIPDSH